MRYALYAIVVALGLAAVAYYAAEQMRFHLPGPLHGTHAGLADDCFAIDSVVNAHQELRGIYRAAGAEDRMEVDIFPGGHDFRPESACAFFEKWLGPVK